MQRGCQSRFGIRGEVPTNYTISWSGYGQFSRMESRGVRQTCSLKMLVVRIKGGIYCPLLEHRDGGLAYRFLGRMEEESRVNRLV